MRSWCFGPFPLILATAAAAQPAPPRAERQSRTELPRMHVWRVLPGPLQNGRVAMPVAGNLRLGLGRFSVSEPAPARTHTESMSRGADGVRRDRGIAAVRLSLRF
jgi:hypothetical protein